MKIAALIVTFDRLEYLKSCLARVLGEEIDHVIVVDNASRDGTGDWLRAQEDPRLTVVSLPKNTGGAGGFEAGMVWIAEHLDADWTVLMDDDAYPLDGAIAAFRAAHDDLAAVTVDPLGAVAAAVFNPDGTICDMNRPSRNPWASWRIFWKAVWGGREGFHLHEPDYHRADPQSVDVGSFVGFFVSREVLKTVGPVSGDYFIYGDDLTYSLDLRKAGFGIAFAPTVVFEHDCGSLGPGGITLPLWKVYYRCRNGVQIARKSAGWAFPFALAYYLRQWVGKTRYYDKIDRPTYRRLMWRGVWDGLWRRMGRQPDLPPRRNPL